MSDARRAPQRDVSRTAHRAAPKELGPPADEWVRKTDMMRKQSAGNELTVVVAVITIAMVLADIVISGAAL